MEVSQPQPSVFAQLVDELRSKSDEELKLLYLKFFSKDLKEEWKNVTNDINLKNISEEEIIKSIQEKRYNQ